MILESTGKAELKNLHPHSFQNLTTGTMRTENMQSRESRQCRFHAIEPNARFAALILTATSSVEFSKEPRSLTVFHDALVRETVKYTVFLYVKVEVVFFQDRLTGGYHDLHSTPR